MLWRVYGEVRETSDASAARKVSKRFSAGRARPVLRLFRSMPEADLPVEHFALPHSMVAPMVLTELVMDIGAPTIVGWHFRLRFNGCGDGRLKLQAQQAQLQRHWRRFGSCSRRKPVQTKGGGRRLCFNWRGERTVDLMPARFVASPNRSFFASTPARGRRLEPRCHPRPRKCSRTRRPRQFSGKQIGNSHKQFTTPICPGSTAFAPAKIIFSMPPEMERPKTDRKIIPRTHCGKLSRAVATGSHCRAQFGIVLTPIKIGHAQASRTRNCETAAYLC